MLTKGIILGKEPNTNKYIVRLPLLETAASKDQFKIKATLCCDDGVLNPFNLNDVVYIGFENSEYDNPVIIGKLSKEGLLDNQKDEVKVSYRISGLEVLSHTQLSKDTMIGDISYQDLYLLIQKASSLSDKLDSGFNDKDIGIYINNKRLRIYLYNFTEADVGKKIQLFRTTHHTSKGFKHPETYGYGVVAERVRPSKELPKYPEVPWWMPNDGFIQTEWTITQEMISNGYFEIDWTYDWVSLVIPHRTYNNSGWTWLENASIYGTAGGRGSVKMKFGLVNNGTLQFLSTGTLYLGTCYAYQCEFLLKYNEAEDYYTLNTKKIYKAVK